MIDTSKQYTFKGRPVRVYADGSDTAGEYIHGAFSNEAGSWALATFSESDLVEVWEPQEGELCYFWDDECDYMVVATFKNAHGYDHFSKFKGELPEAFKGLV